MVDQKRIAFSPAAALSYLRSEEQYVLIDMMQAEVVQQRLQQLNILHIKYVMDSLRKNTSEVNCKHSILHADASCWGEP